LHDDALSDPNHGLLFSSMFLSTFFMRLLPRADSAPLLATISNNDLGRPNQHFTVMI